MGIDQLTLTKLEKVQVIDALRSKCLVKMLLAALQLSKSSDFYQHTAMNREDNYAKIRPRLHSIFKQNYSSYGYRRMTGELRDEGIRLSEKVGRRLMAEECLYVTVTRCRKYSSYAGEIVPAVPNLLARDFTADRPNEKWVTQTSRSFRVKQAKSFSRQSLIALMGRLRVGLSVQVRMQS